MSGIAANPLRNAKHEAVLQAYFADPARVGYRAYVAVYPKSSDAAAKTGFSRLLKDADFSGRLQFLDAGVTERVVAEAAVTIDQVVSELVKIGFANVKNYLRVNDDGEPVIDFSDVNDDQFAALAEVTVEDFVDARAGADKVLDAVEVMEPQGHGGALRRQQGRDVRRVKFRMHNKQAALVNILEHLGGFPAKKHELTGADGGPMQFEDKTEMSELDLARRIAFALEKGARAPRPEPKGKKGKKP